MNPEVSGSQEIKMRVDTQHWAAEADRAVASNGDFLGPNNCVVAVPVPDLLAMVNAVECLRAIYAYCSETLSDEEWNRNVGEDWDKDMVEAMRVPCQEILNIIKGEL